MFNEPKVARRAYHVLALTVLIVVSSATEHGLDVDLSWCLLESQDWVGSDIVRPDCTANPSDPSCADPTNVSPENERIANLYGDDV
ncbi:MAG: hypothetical protein Q9228_008059 [Teloschistes exilis]